VATKTDLEERLERRRRLPWPFTFYASAVGKKWVMGITGIIVLGFIVSHMVGNLHAFEGPAQINDYGEALRDLGGDLLPRTLALWVVRIVLTTAFVLHIHAAYSLTVINRRARPDKYQAPREYLVANYASRTMVWSGTIVGLYIVYHLAHLTWGGAHPDFIRGDVYHNLVVGFEQWPVAAVYIVANLLLGMHIYHGAWSLFQSLGVNNPAYNSWRRVFAAGLAVVVTVGFISVPIAVLTGVIST